MEIKRISLAVLFAFGLILFSCQKPDKKQATASGDYQHGVWFIDEGGFQHGDASLDFYHLDKDSVESNVFENVNGKPLGDVLQCMYHYNNKYYLVVNNSNDVLVTDDQTLKVSSVISNIVYPRYFLPVSNTKAYLTDMSDGGINIINLQTNAVSGLIAYKPKPDSSWTSWTEQLVQYQNHVYVAAVKSGRLLIINSNADKITDSIALGVGLKDLAMDAQNRIWALVDGTLANPNINSKLYCLDTSGKILKSFTFPDISTGPGNLIINAAKDTLYYTYAGIFKMGINDAGLPSQSLISGNGHNFYGLGINPVNGDIYAADALGFSQPGIVFQYNASGKFIKSHRAGIGPNGFLFVP
jgi:hypothetical protein